jgi:branched-chain amino acid transport system substrate-binding protein
MPQKIDCATQGRRHRGLIASLVTIAFSKENEKSQMLLVNGMAGSPTITEQGYQYTWRINVTDNQLNVKAIEHYIKDRGVKRIAFLAENSDYGKPPTKAASERARAFGAEVVAYENTTAAKPTSRRN